MSNPTERMAAKLAEFGIDASSMDFQLAKDVISQIAANKWQLPDDLKSMVSQPSKREKTRDKPKPKRKEKSPRKRRKQRTKNSRVAPYGKSSSVTHECMRCGAMNARRWDLADATPQAQLCHACHRQVLWQYTPEYRNASRLSPDEEPPWEEELPPEGVYTPPS